jgi:orotate phosphoribosyltransferase-like protein
MLTTRELKDELDAQTEAATKEMCKFFEEFKNPQGQTVVEAIEFREVIKAAMRLYVVQLLVD